MRPRRYNALDDRGLHEGGEAEDDRCGYAPPGHSYACVSALLARACGEDADTRLAVWRTAAEDGSLTGPNGYRARAFFRWLLEANEAAMAHPARLDVARAQVAWRGMRRGTCKDTVCRLRMLRGAMPAPFFDAIYGREWRECSVGDSPAGAPVARPANPSPAPFFVPELPHVVLIELGQAPRISYQDYHVLLLTFPRRPHPFPRAQSKS